MFAEVLGIGASLVGGMMGRDSAEEANNLAMQQLYQNQINMDMARQQAAEDNSIRSIMLGEGFKLLERESDIYDYYRNINDENAGIKRDQLDYSRDWAEQARRAATADQDYEKYRISTADVKIADERTRQLEKLISDESTSAQERQQALQELEYTRSIALGERDYDVKKYEADQLQNQLEYQQRMAQYERMVGVANDERNFMIARQEETMRKAGLLSQDVMTELDGLGDLVPARRYGEADVLAAEKGFYNNKIGDMERAADRLSSVNEAGLIRRGVDQSGTGDSSRRQLLQEQLVPLYDKARNDARNEALGYIQGLQNMEDTSFKSMVDARTVRMNEILGGRGIELDVLKNLQDPGSAVSNSWNNLGTATTQPRSLTSAGSYSTPLNVGSAVLNRDLSQLAQLGMSNQMALQTSPYTVGSSSYDATFTPQFGNQTSAASLFGTNGASPLSYNDNTALLARTAAEAGSASSQQFNSAISSIGGMFDSNKKDRGGYFNFGW